ncbi:hypothetical protein ABPG74_012552 [Tetrahymena malaccensis]
MRQRNGDTIEQMIGNTGLVELKKINPYREKGIKIYVKCEYMNPTGSIKDRIAKYIFDTAESEGKLRKGMTVVAASSGNTACSVAFIAAQRGYKCKVITNTKCSKEKQDAPKAFGAEVIVGPANVSADSPDHYMNMAINMCKANPDYYDIDQYDNPLNPLAYYNSLGPEIWNQTSGNIDYFIAAGSTGGTISGTSKYLKEASEGRVQAVLADPYGSVFYQYWKTRELITPGKFQVEGVGKDTIPLAMDMDLIDQCVQIDDKTAFETCYKLTKFEGLMVGGSSGLNVAAALKLASTLDGPATIVTVCPDAGVKYLSKIYSQAWLEQNGFEGINNPQLEDIKQ